jgi:hypothetical protein
MGAEDRLEDRIRTLCARLIEADEGSEDFKKVAEELRVSLTEHIGRIRTNLREYPARGERRRRG